MLTHLILNISNTAFFIGLALILAGIIATIAKGRTAPQKSLRLFGFSVGIGLAFIGLTLFLPAVTAIAITHFVLPSLFNLLVGGYGIYAGIDIVKKVNKGNR